MSKSQAWTIVSTMGTPRELTTGAHYAAYGRFADIERLAATIVTRNARTLRAVA